MGKRKVIVVWLLMVIMLITIAGCKSEGVADIAETAAETNADALSVKPGSKHMITVYVCPPADWNEPYVWAWKDGGENAADYWYGMDYTAGDSYFSEVLPGWIDRVAIRNMEDGSAIDEVVLVPGNDVWIVTDGQKADVYYEDPHIVVTRTVKEDEPEQEVDYEAMKELLPTLEDHSILTSWEYNDFNYAYASEAILAGDYETAIQFFGYCAYEDYRPYGTIFQQLLDGDLEGAIKTRRSMGFTTLDIDLDMTWPEIFCKVMGVTEEKSKLDYILMNNYLESRMTSRVPSFTKKTVYFGEYSAREAENYIGKIQDKESYIPVDKLKSLYKKCGSKANGKVLILRSQKSYPQGSTYYAIDMTLMHHLSHDLYPKSLSEVEYIVLVSYDYNVDGKYRQTFSVGENSTVDYFTFLRMKGQVQLINPVSGKAIQKYDWITGTGEPDAHFSDLKYQCSNMPETGEDIFNAIEKVRELDAE